MIFTRIPKDSIVKGKGVQGVGAHLLTERAISELDGEVEATHRQDEDSANVDKAEDHPVGLCQLVEVVCARWSLSYPKFKSDIC